ncbi:hypothetical protein G647_06223 [Cladophialophora carrionii CBS 160.54]|uniref:FAD-binding domain-containing protein n=1 Tax=Cladophialophora carrionii CBS 160.54 TaxID=1279043 RepID=V9D5K0_9EURO|nr:uncharacterized protein G647_06223 [Cladophialophora carrionii CBS 160.54]ETI22150.1 hypothetical protein G647_06223 [Cladophialophora carrionii CBS 160.54]
MVPKVTYSDLVIIGAGPAGLMAAAWASRLGFNARILDDKVDRVQTGRADGLHVRTLEILDSFGLANAINEKAYQLREICSWNPDPEDESKIKRTERVRAKEEEHGRFCQLGIHQGFIEQNFIDFLRREGRLNVERNTTTKSLQLDEALTTDHAAYPICLRIGRSTVATNRDTADQGWRPPQEEIIKARYLVGADGGHSWTRDQVGLRLEGGKTKVHFGVVDIVPITDFPDIRISCSIHSTKTGSTMTFPREDRLVRFYVQLAETGSEGDDFDTSKVTPEMITEKASKILSPYKLSYKHCNWWSVYTVGQQCAPSFSKDGRVFLVGDAVHTHSPTMGAGMNVSMQDSYNLVWKLGQVIKGIAKPDILDTYNAERQSVAQTLIEMDREMCDFYEKGAGSDAHNYDEFYERFRTFLSGVGVEYGPNALVVPAREDESRDSKSCPDLDNSRQTRGLSRRSLASKIPIGQRLPSFLVLNHAEANIVHVHSMLPADGRWRLLVLAGDISKASQMARLRTLCERMDAPSSFLRTYTPAGDKVDSVIEVLTIHAAPRHKVELFSLPELLRPFDPKLGYDYWKCFANNNAGDEGDFDDAYAKWGVDKDEGCLVVIRPDQHVSLVCGLQEVGEVEQFFSTILVPQQRRNATAAACE